VAVMALGFVVGQVYRWPEERRRKALAAMGCATIAVFVVLRWSNVYGDPSRWVVPMVETSAHLNRFQLTVFSFLNLEKYPPSLLFLCMTLGPALVYLAAAERRQPGWLGRRLLVFGSVPLFFYVLQWPTIHLISRLFQWIAGQPLGWDGANTLDPDYAVVDGTGFSLGVTYLGWALALIVLYPICAWFSEYKRRNPRRRWLAFF
jgi:uncharacterized membrane protein